jgi:hypothetical protein
MVLTPNGQHELRVGSALVGRGADCEIVIDDLLASRQHARISIEGSGVVLEDLHSTNGVYVNGFRITRRTLLREGDRVLIGACELSLFERPAPPSSREEALATPPRRPRVPKPDEVPPTARESALRIVGSLASRLAAAGKVEEATRVMSAHLNRVLDGAKSGLDVPRELCSVASQHAIDLAGWSMQGVWLDYVVELHLAASAVMSLDTIARFDAATRLVGECDRLLLHYYVESLRARQHSLDTDERSRLALLCELSAI